MSSCEASVVLSTVESCSESQEKEDTVLTSEGLNVQFAENINLEGMQMQSSITDSRATVILMAYALNQNYTEY